MIIKSKKPVTKWDSPTFIIKDISREKLALILCFAEDGLTLPENEGKYDDLKKIIESIHRYINSDAMVRFNPLEL
jgi:hypothetical protein